MNPGDIGRSDQDLEAIADTVTIYFHSLITKGSTREEALALTISFQESLFDDTIPLDYEE